MDDVLALTLAEQHAVHRRIAMKQATRTPTRTASRRRASSASSHLAETGLERDREQEREQDLHAGHRDADLGHQLLELTRRALALVLPG